MRNLIFWFCSAAVCITAIPRAFAAEQYCSSNSDSYCSYLNKVYPYFKEMEAALVSSNKTLFVLQQIFFPVFHTQPREFVRLTVCVTMDAVLPSNRSLENVPDSCNVSVPEDRSERCWDLQWSRSHLLSLITVDQLLAFESVIVDIVYSLIARKAMTSYLFIRLHIDALPCVPPEADLLRSLIMVLSLARAYARVGGRPSDLNPEDKGYVSLHYNYYAASDDNVAGGVNYSHEIRVLLICVFVLLNVCIVLVIVVLTAHRERLSMRLTGMRSSIYWAAAVALAIFNTAYITAMIIDWLVLYRPTIMQCLIVMHHHCEIPSDSSVYTHVVVSVILKAGITLSAFSIEFLAALKLSKPACKHIPIPPAVLKILHCCRCRGTRGARAIHTFAIWNHMLFVQISVGMAALPLSILGLIAPLETISVVGVFVLGMLLLLVTAAYFLHQSSSIATCHCPRWSTCALFFIKSGVFVVFLLLAIALSILYYLILNAGVSPSSISGVLLSLLPSFLLSAIGLLIKSKLFGKSDNVPLAHYNRLEELARSEEGADEAELALLQHQDEA